MEGDIVITDRFRELKLHQKEKEEKRQGGQPVLASYESEAEKGDRYIFVFAPATMTQWPSAAESVDSAELGGPVLNGVWPPLFAF